LHLERDGIRLRLYDPVQKRRLLTSAEARDLALSQRDQALSQRDQALSQRDQAQTQRQTMEQALNQQVAENERLLQRIRELEG
jgi:hypothetical protein